MKTKIVILTTGIMLVFATIQAQTGRTSFGIRAGVNFQNLNGEDFEGDDLDNKLKTGFHIGANADIPIATDFYIQPGVLFSTKGAKNDDGDTKINISYIEVPVNFLYKPVLGTGRLLLGIGPYVAFGIGGKVESDGVERDIEFEKEITLAQATNGTPYFKGFDAGGNLLFGYEFSNKIFAQLNAQLGLVKINPDISGFDDNDMSVKNTGFGLSVGYRF